ncbi:MAG: sulfur oxidation c-type cytochrome SoxX [Acetobacteraceae bacterium]|nr:sulfur oxidation c-type cytochrome SoxX [Acetobacteraceae bacterium]
MASLGLMLLTGAGIEQPLDGLQGDPARGETVVIRQSSTCTLCHAGPFPNPHLQGNVGPDLHGVGRRLTVPELRERLVDASRLNPDTVMPSFFKTERFTRVGAPWRGKPILSAQEIEDAVAYLATLQQ